MRKVRELLYRRSGVYTGTLFFCLALYWPAPVVQAAESIDKMRLWRSPERTRLVFDLSGAPDYKLETRRRGKRIEVHFSGMETRADPSVLDFSGTPIQNLFLERRAPGHLYLNLALSRAVRPRHFVLPPNPPYGHRLVLDLYDHTPRVPIPVKTVSDRAGKRDIIIAVDAGHGGDDPGAVSVDGVQEKDLVLSMARELKRQLGQLAGFSAYLVRDGDYYVSLGERRERARRMKAHLLLSLHADAFNSPQAHGSSVYALSLEGSTSAEAQFLAERGNKADLMGGVDLEAASKRNPYLAATLLDLAINSGTLVSALELGDRLLATMKRVSHLHKPEVERAAFAVLKSPDVPSLLIESGFISNPRDLQNLVDAGYRRALVRAIVAGVHEYFVDNPPAGTLLAWQREHPQSNLEYIIQKGDTLWEIARDHGVSVKSILELNTRKDAGIRVGERLLIPRATRARERAKP